MVDKLQSESAKHSTSKSHSKSAWWKVALYSVGLLVWVGVSIIASQLAIGYILLLTIGSDSFQEPMWQAIFSALAYTLAMLLIIILPIATFRKRNKKTPGAARKFWPSLKEQLDLQGWLTWADIGLALIGFLAYLLLAAGLTTLFQFFPWFEVDEVQDVGFNILSSGSDRIIAFITLVVIAPIAEEIIFRGWLYGKLRRKFTDQMSNYAGMTLAIFLVSLLFGIIHMQWNVGVNVFAMSVVLCGLREITGTIHAGILIHMLKNGIAFYLLYVVGM